MESNMTNLRKGFTRLTLLVLGLATTTGYPKQPVFGQGLTPDPYNIVGEYNGQYAPYMYAVEPAPGNVFPNSNRMRPRSTGSGTNGFQSFADSLDGAEPEDVMPGLTQGRAGIGTPYYRAYRKFDQDYGRLYRPNETADRSYATNQTQLNAKYFEAMKEPNSRKRAQLLREYNMENLRSSRSLSTLRGSADREKSRVAPRPSGARVPDLLPESPLRRSPNPSSGAVRRPATPGLDLPPLRTRSGSSLYREGVGGTPVRSRPGSAARRGDGLGPTDPGLGSPAEVLDRSEELDRPVRTPASRTPSDLSRPR